MDPGNPRPHLSLEEEEAYLADRLPPARLLAVDEHLARCGGCARRVGAAFAFQAAWEGWAGAQQAAGALQARVVQALRALRRGMRDPRLRGRLGRWLGDRSGRATVVLRLVLREARGGSGIVVEAPGEWPFNRVSISALGAGRAAIEKTVVKMAPGLPIEVRLNAFRPGVEIALGTPAAGGEAPLALLIPGAGSQPPRVVAPTWSEEGWLARCEEVSGGRYLLVFEPQG